MKHRINVWFSGIADGGINGSNDLALSYLLTATGLTRYNSSSTPSLYFDSPRATRLLDYKGMNTMSYTHDIRSQRPALIEIFDVKGGLLTLNNIQRNAGMRFLLQ